MRSLITQEDGRRYAVAVLAAIRESGPEPCRANVPAPRVYQEDCLIAALLEIKERATGQAAIGFAVILTDALGTRGLEPVPEYYEQLERDGRFGQVRLKRLRRIGSWLATWNAVKEGTA